MLSNEGSAETDEHGASTGLMCRVAMGLWLHRLINLRAQLAMCTLRQAEGESRGQQ